MSPPYTVHVFCRALYAGSGRCDNASVDGDHATKYGSHPPTHMLDLLDKLSLLVVCWKCVSVCFRFLFFVLGFWHYFLCCIDWGFYRWQLFSLHRWRLDGSLKCYSPRGGPGPCTDQGVSSIAPQGSALPPDVRVSESCGCESRSRYIYCVW